MTPPMWKTTLVGSLFAVPFTFIAVFLGVIAHAPTLWLIPTIFFLGGIASNVGRIASDVYDRRYRSKTTLLPEASTYRSLDLPPESP